MYKTSFFYISLLLASMSPVLVKGWSWSDVAWAGLAGATAVVATPAALTAVGFTSAGVGACSLAAAAQSTFYGASVASGSVFAVVQSAGAAGIGIKGASALFSTVAAGTMYARKEEE